VLGARAYRQLAEREGQPLALSLERENGVVSRFETWVLPQDHPHAAATRHYVERLVKFLLWQRGGFRLHVGGPAFVAAQLQALYAAGGAHAFDVDFMGRQVYERPFEIVACRAEDAPAANETGKPLGRHLDGCRIGFDLGASDRKVSAVCDGQVVFSQEVVWEPRKHSDPAYHYGEIDAALRSAAAHLPRVDAIGGSSAGIYIDNRPMVASLFRAIPPERFEEVKQMFLRLRGEWGVPLEVINDGDVTALAGSMSLEDGGVLGIALGSSQAVGYVDDHGHVLGWLNELAFAPVDDNPTASLDEWSGDRGCGSTYFSQQAVFRLAPRAGIAIPTDCTDAEKLKFVQEKLEAGHPGARQIWENMGVYLGYALAHYADFYAIRHTLILGRCTSGAGGDLLLQGANQVLQAEFPELAERLHVQLPDEKSRRVGQSIAAASLPALHED
jgi:predicted NBD/HSP70 family sugar kinase